MDGLLHDAGFLAHDMGRAAVSRIKILTQLNIAERRLPQDGRARVRAGDREYDIRVATIPTIHGESVSIRFLSATNAVPKLNALGLKQRDLRVIEEQSSHAHGLIVVTGPTGSGKTTTLAAVLNRLNNPTRKILTIEDPVEYQVEGINQIQVRPEIGLTFAATLRSLLRHDPDIIMVGEMRDSETAKIGVNAALTGHLVLTTLHTNSAAGAVTRLLDFDVQSYLIASTCAAWWRSGWCASSASIAGRPMWRRRRNSTACRPTAFRIAANPSGFGGRKAASTAAERVISAAQRSSRSSSPTSGCAA